MEIGKLPNDVLKSLVFSNIKESRKEVLIRPSIGEDCAAVDFGEELCVISSDPITGTDNEIGTIAVHVSCNDIAASGSEPIGLMVTMLVPPGETEANLESVIKQLSVTAASLNVDILGGHTEVTDAVNRFVISITAIGKTTGKNVVKTSGAKPGDDLILTKYAGLEGTSILAHEHQFKLAEMLGSQIVARAQKLIEQISVIKEGMIAAKHGAHAMHDVTEGGVLGAIWEMCEASGCGAEVFKEQIPVLDETREICRYFNIDPLRLISSGSMLIAAKDGAALVDKLQSNGIMASVIGKITAGEKPLLHDENKIVIISPPYSDELYKVKKSC
ncbi:MAG: AIR synthase [Clostridiaceae bacterium]|nr:AIR synthase [Clostridiaceae bacterium]